MGEWVGGMQVATLTLVEMREVIALTGELLTLRAAAEQRRAVRRQITDAVVDHGQRSPEAVELRQVLQTVDAD